MRLILRWWSGSEYEGRERITPFEYESAEKLYLDIENIVLSNPTLDEERKRLWRDFYEKRTEESMKKASVYEKIYRNSLQITDERGRIFDVEDLLPPNVWTTINILTIDEWFEENRVMEVR